MLNKQITKNIAIIFCITIAGLLCSSAFHFMLSLKNNIYPYNTFLFNQPDRFSDFTIVLQEAFDLNPYLGHNSAQYPLLCFVGYLLALVATNNFNFHYIYFFYVFACLFIFVYIVDKLSDSSQKVFSIVTIGLIFLTSYPFLFAVDRGNFELLVFITVAISLYYYKVESYYKSAFFLACAASMKLLPLYYLVIFIKDRKYKELAFSTGCFLAINLGILSLFRGGVYNNLLYLVNGGNIKNNVYFTGFTGGDSLFQRSVSLFNFTKIILTKFHLLYIYNQINFISYYKLTMVILVIALSLYVIFLVKDFRVSILVLSIIIILFPYISADYKMLYLFLPILFFLCNGGTCFQTAYSVLFGFALIPKSYYFLGLQSDSGFYDITISSILNPLLLIMLLLMAFYETSCKGYGTCRSDRKLMQ
ncbi:MAG: glycosyltransferase 87 family protein [Desulfuromonadaceae bacterium]